MSLIHMKFFMSGLYRIHGLLYSRFHSFMTLNFPFHSVKVWSSLYLYVLLQLRPNFCDAWSNLASAYMRKGRLNEAAQCCRQALALNPLLVNSHLSIYFCMYENTFAYVCMN